MSETITNETTGKSAVIEVESVIEPWMNPRDETDTLSVMCVEHPRWNLGGGKHDLNAIPETIGITHGENPVEYFQREHGARVVLALDLYEHSGLRMKARGLNDRREYPFNDPWDAGMVGFVFDTPETRETVGAQDWSDDQIREALIEDVEIYDMYLQGEVYVVSCDDDSVGGILGYKYAVEQAQEMIAS